MRSEFASLGAVADPSDVSHFAADQAALAKLVPPSRPGSSLEFQIASIDALPCSLWFACRYAACPDPAAALYRSVGAGGDTDTVASMCGAVVGALHGAPEIANALGEAAGEGAAVGWLPARLVNALEDNHVRGRTFALACAARLAQLDLRDAASVREVLP